MSSASADVDRLDVARRGIDAGDACRRCCSPPRRPRRPRPRCSGSGRPGRACHAGSSPRRFVVTASSSRSVAQTAPPPTAMSAGDASSANPGDLLGSAGSTRKTVVWRLTPPPDRPRLRPRRSLVRQQSHVPASRRVERSTGSVLGRASTRLMLAGARQTRHRPGASRDTARNVSGPDVRCEGARAGSYLQSRRPRGRRRESAADPDGCSPAASDPGHA